MQNRGEQRTTEQRAEHSREEQSRAKQSSVSSHHVYVSLRMGLFTTSNFCTPPVVSTVNNNQTIPTFCCCFPLFASNCNRHGRTSPSYRGQKVVGQCFAYECHELGECMVGTAIGTAILCLLYHS